VTSHLDVLTIGRVGIDLYPLQDNVGLKDVQAFAKSIGAAPPTWRSPRPGTATAPR
jgi:5-dehydro-2-deoxygluconokinase